MTTSQDTRGIAVLPPDNKTVGRQARRVSWSQVFRTRNLVVGVTIVVVGYLVIWPLAYLIYNSVIGADGAFSLGSFKRAYTGEGSLKLIRNSFVYGVGSTVLAILLATPLAFVYARTDVRFKQLLFAGTLVPIIMPAILYAPAWIYLSSPRIGLINWALKPIFGGSVFNIYSIWGMIWVEGIHLAPIAFLMMATAFRNMDPSLEESAQVSGLGRFEVFRRITLPLVRPALIPAVLVVLVLALESFDVPVLIGQRNGIFVITSQIYFLIQQFPADLGAAGALGLGLLAIAAVISVAGNYRTRRVGSYVTVTGKGFRPREIALGKARPLVTAGLLFYFFVTVVLPVGSLLYTSLLPNFRTPTWGIFKTFTLSNFSTVLSTPSFLTAVRNSVLLGVGSATIVMVLAVVLSWFVVRTRARGRGVVSGLSFTPLAVPGVVMGLAIGFIYLRSPIPIYGTLWILVIAYVTRFLPYAMRYAGVAMHQVGQDLEESAYVSGLSWGQTFRRVLIPLTRSGIVSGWIYVLIVSFRELGVSVMLYSPNSSVLPVVIFTQYTNGFQDQLAATGVMMTIVLTALVVISLRIGKRSQSGGILQ